MKQFSLTCLFIFVFLTIASTKEKASVYRFDFGEGKIKKGWTRVTSTTFYSRDKGYGIIPSSEMFPGENDSKDQLKSDFLSSKKPFYFEVNLPEGHYQVNLTLGGAREGSLTTVKAESRRLMLEEVKTRNGGTLLPKRHVHHHPVPGHVRGRKHRPRLGHQLRGLPGVPG